MSIASNPFNPFPTEYTLRIKVTSTNPETKTFLEKYYSGLKRGHFDGDSGVDLVLPHDLVLSENNKCYKIDFEIQTEMYFKDEYHSSFYIYPRSSISNFPIVLANSVGIIDAGYRGNLMAKVRYLKEEEEEKEEKEENEEKKENFDFVLKKGTKLFQICAPDLKPIRVHLLDDFDNLSSTSRNAGGFGSTN